MARFPLLPDAPSPADGQTLVYSEGLDRWVPSDSVEGVSSWNDLTDKPTVIAAGSTQTAARSAIGAASTSHNHHGSYVQTVNGQGPDAGGNVEVDSSGAGDWAGLNTVGVGRAVFIPAGGSVPAGTPDYTIIIELAD